MAAARSRTAPTPASARGMSIHTVFSAECNAIFDWHSVALFRSQAQAGQPGGITRLLACSSHELEGYHGLDIGPTFVHENLRHVSGMNYAAFNKPASVHFWLDSGSAPAGVAYVMQLDADMLIHRPVDPTALGAGYDSVVSAPYNFLTGTATELPAVFGVRNREFMARVGSRVAHDLETRALARP